MKPYAISHVGKTIISLLLAGVLLIGCASCKTTRFQDQNDAGNSGDTADLSQSESDSAEDNNTDAPESAAAVPEETTEAARSVLPIGSTIETDMAQLTLTKVQFADRLGLDNADNWLKPKSDFGGLTPDDGKVFVWFSFTVKNISKSDLGPLHLWEAKIDYNDGFIYDGAVFASEGLPHWSTSSAVSKNVGLKNLDPLQENEYYGYIPCVSEVQTNTQAPLLLIISLQDSTGMKEFTFDIR